MSIMGLINSFLGPKPAEQKAGITAQAPTQVSSAQAELLRAANSAALQAPSTAQAPVVITEIGPTTALGPVLEQVSKLLSKVLPAESVTAIMNYIAVITAPHTAPTAAQAAPTASPQPNNEAAELEKIITEMLLKDPNLMQEIIGGGTPEANKPAAPAVAATNPTLAPTPMTANLGAAGATGATNTTTTPQAQATTPAPAANPMAAIMELLGSAAK